MSSESLTDDHVASDPELFLDTSIHCCELKGPAFRARIDKVLALFEFTGTSSYSKVEFGNVVLATAVYYLRQLKETKSLEATLYHIGNVLVPQFHGRYITWSFNLLSVILGSTDAERTERARLSLTRLLKYGTKCVEDTSDHMADGTACYWAKRALDRGRDKVPVWKTPNCKRSRKLCKLDEFFLANRQTFEKIKADIDALDPKDLTSQLRNFSTVIGDALADPQCLLDYKTGCKKLADAIIAVDSQAYRNMFSQNSEESTVLCKTLGQTFYFLPPLATRGVEVFNL